MNRPTNRDCSTSDFSIAFGEADVLIDPTNTTLGPFTLSVPAGTYEITMSSWLGFTDDPAQTMEQWFFTTDSGYTSPLTTDSAELVFTDVATSQTLPATSSITLRHKGNTGVTNSVHPLCIGLRSVAAPVTTTTAAPTTTTAAPTTTTAAPTTTTTVAVSPGGQGTDGTTTTTAAPTTTTAAPTTTVASGAGAEEEIPELALTGPGDLSMSLGLTGAALMLAGVAAVRASRRSEED